MFSFNDVPSVFYCIIIWKFGGHSIYMVSLKSFFFALWLTIRSVNVYNCFEITHRNKYTFFIFMSLYFSNDWPYILLDLSCCSVFDDHWVAFTCDLGFIIIMSCRQHRYPWPSLATSPYHSSPPAGLLSYILCPHIAAVCKFGLVVLLLLGHMWGSIGVHRLRARPCFSSSVLRVWTLNFLNT